MRGTTRADDIPWGSPSMVMALRALATSDHYRLVVNKIRQDAARDFDNVLAGLQGDALHLAAGRASAMNELLRNLGEIDA